MPVSDKIDSAAEHLFSLLAVRFPVMCGSDEFYFFPRLQHRNLSFAEVDRLDHDQISDTITELKTIRRKIESVNTENDVERTIDIELLKICVSAVLIELEQREWWRYNPILYLKIAFIGLEQALTGAHAKKSKKAERVKNRLHAIPQLLGQAKSNVCTVPETYYNASLSMIQDCHEYLLNLKDFSMYEEFESHLSMADAALDSLRSHITSSVKREPDYRFNYPTLEITMRDHFQTGKNLKEVFDIGLEESEEARKALLKITREINREIKNEIRTANSWKELYASYSPMGPEITDTVAIYRQETLRLLNFFQKKEFEWVDTCLPLDVVETPSFLRSVRGGASFSASVSRRKGDRDTFYVTAEKASSTHAATRLHREYKFLCAHEGFPGHYLLDCVRRSIKNPIRRAIESPLFYEGWAYYSESLLEEDGYIQTPIERLVHHKRTLWRAARCMIDAGLPTGFIDREKAEKLLEEIGYPVDEAAQLVDRFQLNPGYHLCYTLGRNEILNLRSSYSTLTGRKVFHRVLLEGGEIPFHLVERRFQKTLTGGKKA